MNSQHVYDLYTSALYKLIDIKLIYFMSINKIKIYFPHINYINLNKLMSILSERKRVIMVAIPSVMVLEIYHVVKLKLVNNNKKHMYKMQYYGMFINKFDKLKKILYLKETIKFEINKWSSYLKKNDWNEVFSLDFYSSSKILTTRSYAFTICIIYDDNLETILLNKNKQSTIELLNEHIKYVAINKLICKEIKYTKKIFRITYCDYCLSNITSDNYCTCHAIKNHPIFNNTEQIQENIKWYIINNHKNIIRQYPTCNYLVTHIKKEKIDSYVGGKIKYKYIEQPKIITQSEYDSDTKIDEIIPVEQNTPNNNDSNIILDDINLEETITDIYDQFESEILYYDSNASSLIDIFN